MTLEHILDVIHQHALEVSEECFQKTNVALQGFNEYADSAIETQRAKKQRWLPPKTPKGKSKVKRLSRKSRHLKGSRLSTSVRKVLVDDDVSSDESSSAGPRKTRRGRITSTETNKNTIQSYSLPKRSTCQSTTVPVEVEQTVRRSNRTAISKQPNTVSKKRMADKLDQDSNEEPSTVKRTTVSKKRALETRTKERSATSSKNPESPIQSQREIEPVTVLKKRVKTSKGNRKQESEKSSDKLNNNEVVPIQSKLVVLPATVLKKGVTAKKGKKKEERLNSDTSMHLHLPSLSSEEDINRDETSEAASSSRSAFTCEEKIMQKVSVVINLVTPDAIVGAGSKSPVIASNYSSPVHNDNQIINDIQEVPVVLNTSSVGKTSTITSSRGTFVIQETKTVNNLQVEAVGLQPLATKTRDSSTFISVENALDSNMKEVSVVCHPLSPELVAAMAKNSKNTFVEENKENKTKKYQPSTASNSKIPSAESDKKKVTEMMDESIVILDTEDEESSLKRPVKNTRAALKALVKVEPASPSLNHVTIGGAISKTPQKILQTTLRLNSLQDPKRSLRSHVISSPKILESPKQLFSAYTKGSIKQRAEAFENIAKEKNLSKTPNKAPAKTILEIPPTENKKPRRSSLIRYMKSYQVLQQASRGSTTSRRSTLSRARVRASMNECAYIAVHMGNNAHEKTYDVMEIGDTDEESDQNTPKAEEQPNLAEASEIPRRLSRHRSSHSKLDSQVGPSVVNTSLPTSSTSDEEWMDESPQKGDTPTVGAKRQGSTGGAIKKVPQSFAFPGFKKTSIERSFSTWSAKTSFSLKSTANKTLTKSNYPGSESRQGTKNRVAALAQLYDKGVDARGGSCGRLQNPSCNGSQTTLMANSVKNFQRPAYAISSKTRAALLTEELERKRIREEEVLHKKQEFLKQRTEETKRKNEEKLQRVKENRIRKNSENQRKTLELQEQANAQAKRNQEQIKAKMDAKKLLRLKREMEIEERRKQEEEARLAKQKEEQLELQRQQELAHLRKQQQKQAATATAAACKAVPKTSTLNGTVSANLNQTYTADQSSDANNYDMTPHRCELPKEELKDSNNYDIEDLNSGDETDEESDPKKQIPSWAQGVNLRLAVISQHRNPINTDAIFNPVLSCDLSELFTVQRSRFKVRTSSAVWTEPIRE